jgi:hypothetical protein
MTPSSSQSAPAASNFDKGDSVTLIIGPEKQELLVHANYIERTSEFFRTALKKEWLKGQTRTISLPIDKYETMTTYLRFVCGAQIPIEFDFHQPRGTPIADRLHACEAAYVSYAKLYVVGSRLMDKTFKNAVVTKMFDLFDDCYGELSLGPDPVNMIYNGTRRADPARLLVVDMQMEHSGFLSSEFDSRFLLDLAQGFSDTVRRQSKPGRTSLKLRDCMS